MNTKPTTKNSLSMEYQFDDDGFLHLKQSFPNQGEIVVHVSMLSGFADTLREISDREAKARTEAGIPLSHH
jgi:hypothetical protein